VDYGDAISRLQVGLLRSDWLRKPGDLAERYDESHRKKSLAPAGKAKSELHRQA
jgi:hypothetical protein